MKEFIKKLIGRLEKQAEQYRRRGFEHEQKGYSAMADKYYGKQCSYLHSIEIVNELAEEYKLLENIEQLNNGWIACSERLPQENEPVGTLCQIVNVMLKNGTVTSGWCNRYLEKWYVLDHHHDYPLPYEYKDVIAWQPLPKPYKE